MGIPVRPRDFAGRFLTDRVARSAYSEGAGPFRIVPAAVAIPADRDDGARLLRHAADEHISLHPRGAGSGMPGGNLGDGVVIDLTALDRPARVSLEQTANVGAAVRWEMLTRLAAPFGFRLGPDPSSGAFCTLGGMVATNAAGARSLRAGSIRSWVRGVEFATVDGEVGWLGRQVAERPASIRQRGRRRLVERLAAEDRFEPVAARIRAAAAAITGRFPKTRKNASGYALDRYVESDELVDLVVGSEGTLGVVTRIELQLEVAPVATGTLLLGLDAIDALGDVVSMLDARGAVAIELFDRTFLDLVTHAGPVDLTGTQAALLAEFEGPDERAVRDIVEATREAARGHCPTATVAFAASEQAALWHVRHAASATVAALPPERRSLQIVEDGCVPRQYLTRYLREVRRCAEEVSIPIVAFGHAGDGHLHVNAVVDTGERGFEQRLAQLLDSVTTLVLALGGTPSGEHGDGRLRAHLLERVYGEPITELFGAVKAAFDPAGVLNPGVVLPAGASHPLDHLKVGDGAAAIPHDIALGLRHMERTRGWADSPLRLAEVRT